MSPRRRQSLRLCLHRSPQWVIQARVLDINRRLLVPLFFKVHQRRINPFTYKVMARVFWSAFGRMIKENFSTKSPIFRADAAHDAEKLFWEGQARHRPPARSSH